MSNDYIISAEVGFFPEVEENVFTSIFKQYESVIVKSLITSFGLDFLVKDQYGGDVDTINNVRKIGIDEQMHYKNKKNESDYKNRGDYNSAEYHRHSDYIKKNRETSQEKDTGELIDAYTGKNIKINEKSDLDHVISAKEIHDDRGRTLAGLSGTDLANSDENLQVTNPHTNRTKKADNMNDFIKKYGDEYTEEEKNKMKEKDKISRKAYEAKIAKAYYTSPKFMKDTAKAAGKIGITMGLKQAIGFVFTEVWFAVKEEFKLIDKSVTFDFEKFLHAIHIGVKRGFSNAKQKYKMIVEQFSEGAISGLFSSLTTTICNIFFTTAKNVVKIIRESYASVIQAAKILFINPDNLDFGERMRAVVKIISTGASIVVGSLVSEAIEATPIGTIPVVGEIIQTFCGTLVTGILSCTLLYYLDRSSTINKLVDYLNKIPSISKEFNYYSQQVVLFEEYAAKLISIDVEKLREEINIYNNISENISKANTGAELNEILIKSIKSIGFTIPWQVYSSFDNFMNDKNAVLVIE